MKTNVLKVKIDNMLFIVFKYLFDKNIWTLWGFTIPLIILKLINTYFLIDLVLFIVIYTLILILIINVVYLAIFDGLKLLNKNVISKIDEIANEESKK